MNSAAAQNNTPFFLLGCVRSGTTLLRDLLRQHPRLESPEETHFFRWADPFGSDRYRSNYKKSRLLKQHRAMDGVDEFSFHYTLNHAQNRREMMDNYCLSFLKQCGNPDGRCFDKTPQNVYGVLMISAAYPEACFIHIHRHPLNVVASLIEGAVMPVHDLNAAINYWVEAMSIMDQFKHIGPDRVVEVAYETLTHSPRTTVLEILESLGEDGDIYPPIADKVHPEKNKYIRKLSAEQIRQVMDRTELYRSRYGYTEAP